MIQQKYSVEDLQHFFSLVIEKETICKVGCLLTSVSMALNYYNIKADGQLVDPGVLNKWLRDNNGYTSNDDLYEERLEKLSPNIKYLGEIKS